MPKYLKKIGRIFALEWSTILQYRADMLLWTMSILMMPIVSMALWYAVSKTSSQELSSQEVFTYYLALMVVSLSVTAWGGYFLSEEIRTGSITTFLIRPISIFWKHITNNLVEKGIRLGIFLPVVALAMWLLSDSISPSIYQGMNIGLFLLSLVIAAILSFSLDILFGVLAFWLEDTMQLRRYNMLFFEFASGVMIPLAFLPSWAQTAFNLLPFRYVIGLPAEIISGQHSFASAMKLIAIQLVWASALTIIVTVLWRRGLKRYAIPGN